MSELIVRDLGLEDYNAVFEKMREFTLQRTQETKDELWCVQHPPVFTLGANADQQHILTRSDIPIIQSDRGGQVTYHAPGQMIVYILIDLRRKQIGVKELVQQIELAIVNLLATYNITAMARADAHGVYVEGEKIASLGLRVRKGCSYHGMALNMDMDLSPFNMINPCGFSNLKVTQLKDLGVDGSLQTLTNSLISQLCVQLDYQY